MLFNLKELFQLFILIMCNYDLSWNSLKLKEIDLKGDRLQQLILATTLQYDSKIITYVFLLFCGLSTIFYKCNS